ncbi:uncharacterized protein DC041_0005616 [Schistosoma bovis]|uniref:DUF3752 domain-containing protein n=1 Tax=Schistosoma bovis TaxID=6184 RepID=A0A430QPJ0_SCHBO|nr:uncharacterized protein DC041_0005616 [Schistosoma bovis]
MILKIPIVEIRITRIRYNMIIEMLDPSSFVYSRPVILQHFPLYRTSDSGCSTKPMDAMPKHLRKTVNRPKLDCLSKEATKQLLESLRPRLILSGHTHYSCKMSHRFGNQSDSAVEWYNKVGMSRKTDSKNDDRVFGPVFQPDDLVPSTGIGPALPSDLFKQKLNKESESVNYKSPTNFEEIDTIGPLLPGQEIREEWRHLKSGLSPSFCLLIYTAQYSGGLSRVTVKSEKLKRDTWMTELLPRSSVLNSLKSCKFRQDISTPLHDASWFTTPSDDSKQLLTSSQTNQSIKDTVKYQRNEAYDQKMAKIASKHQISKEKSSLLELHENKLKHKLKKKHEKKSKKHKHKSKKHKKERGKSSSPSTSPPGKSTRRPFDRKKDLKLSRIDTAARKAIIEHSKKLSIRFSHGSQQYL